ncbi:MAG: type IX secretion system membrane protein PorP/SprF [Bacteroidales bacterium]|nr:type IX secretion system membrane protein PorP/SprF [Bacteroidales bacterium]
MKLFLQRYIVLISICMCFVHTYAQNDINVSNYMFDEISYNPACTGEGETFRASILARKHWLGIDGAPLFQIVTVDGRTKRLGGLGLHVVNDQVGFENNVTATVNYSYGVNLGARSRLSLGFAAGFIDHFVDNSEFVYQNQVQDDPFGYVEDNFITPTLNVGVQLVVRQLTIGLSSTHITQSQENLTACDLPKHYYGFASYRINANENMMIVPSVLMKMGNSIMQMEYNANVYFYNNFWLGASFRTNESVVGLAGLILKNRIFIGYSYDCAIGDKRRYSSGSHEIFMSWRMRKDPRQKGFYQSTRLFN